ncbi:NADH:ubiquinone oxidoreductase, NDUFB9/B22 subunit, putative [Ixodes scapularis]|uniref:NADH dehydrogenase [ubiquinone] 1 beta subcomplex subunit 9 n=1 Tax=Ixodes scapularis TaxID=6945 RepID=B7QM05_IXOSC|nr:NADH:ubiquinone oxidoreductase, NDUFB9/B22 subunit, putative [Ixodes scapularis]|eukprot:XP_002416210.1 NADH:ubiquinone oxidoreductase, NDUFB9/B22 subunit, putative [Ixodes scapularis]
MAHLVTRVVSHKFQVCSLYKRALRNLEAWCVERDDYRIQAVELRERFENYRHIKDMRIAKELLDQGEEELFEKAHPQLYHREPLLLLGPVGGRDSFSPQVLDYWHPLEKAQYPEYFARREERKKEYIANWEKKYGKPQPEHQHH